MEKLFNWTIGSFFRTIGRLIAYFAIGAFIAYILSNSNIKLPRITNLFFEKVNAASIVIPSTSATTFWNTNGWSNFDVTSDQTRAFKTIYSSDDEINEYISFGSFSGSQPQNFDYIAFQISMTYPKVMSYTNSLEDHYCSKYSCSDEVYDCNSGTCYRYCRTFSCSTYASRSTGSILTQIPNEITMHNMMFTITYTDNNTNTCFLQENEVVCPTDGKTPKQLNIYIHFKAVKTTTFDLYVSRYTMLYKAQNMQGAIEEQTQQQQQQHNETMTIITDTNTTQEQNETISFFSNFTFQSEGNHLTDIITAPLRVFTSISTGSFSDLCFTLKSKNVCFPNGNMIWQKSNRDSTWFGTGSISTGIQAFVTLFNLVVGGYLAYKMGASIKRLIEDFLDPTNTRIEVMKL